METTYYVTLRSSESVYGTTTFPPYTKSECAEKVAQIKTLERETRTLIVVEDDYKNQLKQLSDAEIDILLGETMIFRVHVPSRPAFMSPIFRGVGNLDNAQEALAEFKEDVPNLADQVRIEYQPIPEWKTVS